MRVKQKRFISGLMALVFILSLFPTSVFAVDDRVSGDTAPISTESQVQEPAQERDPEPGNEPADPADPTGGELGAGGEDPTDPADPADPADPNAGSGEGGDDPVNGGTDPVDPGETFEYADPSLNPENAGEAGNPEDGKGLNLVLGSAADPALRVFVAGDFAEGLDLGIDTLNEYETEWARNAMQRALGYEVGDFMAVKLVNSAGQMMMIGQDNASPRLPVRVSGSWLDGYVNSGEVPVFALMNGDAATAELVAAGLAMDEDGSFSYDMSADCFLVLMIARNNWVPFVEEGSDNVSSEPAEGTDPGETFEYADGEEPQAEVKVEDEFVRDLSAEWNGFSVLAEIPKNVLAEAAELVVGEFNENYARETVLSVVNAGSEQKLDIASIAAVDISFKAGGFTVYPNGNAGIRITLSSAAIAGMSEPRLFHLVNGSAVEVKNAAFDTVNGTVVFTSLAFSPYAIVDFKAAENAAGKLGGRIAGDEEEPGSTRSVDDNIRAEAQDLYGAGGDHNPMISVSITPTSTGTALAGDLVEYTVAYSFEPIDSWQNSNEEWIQYFREFYDNEVILHLPAGLLIPANQAPVQTQLVIDPNDPTNDNLEMDHYYTIKLNVLDPAVGPQPIDTQGGSLGGSFTIKFFVGNNGTPDSINTYDLPDDLAVFHAKFNILGEDGTPLTNPDGTTVTYMHEDTATARDVVTTSPDEWTVKKTGVPAETKLSDDKSTVTFTWDIEVGLKDGTGIFSTDDKYNRKGREYLETLTLNDLFSTLLNPAGTTVTDQATVITVKKQLTSTTWGTAVDFDNDDDIVIWNAEDPTQVNSNLVMNSKELIDSDGNGSLDQLTAKYTKYRVTVKYPVDPSWIAQYPTTTPNVLKENNTATITAEFAKLPDQTVSAPAEQTVTLPIDGASTLTVDKLLTDYTGNEAAYDEALYGVIEYEVTSANNFTVFDSNGQPMRDDEGGYMSGRNSYVIKSGVTYYLAPNITYTVKENMTDAQKNVMTQTDSPKYFDKNLPQNYAWIVTFHNMETVGKIVITKKDDAGRNMTDTSTQQAGFTLYDSTGTTPVEGFEEQFTGNDAKATFVRVPYGSYILKETTVPDGYVGAGDIPVTVSATDPNGEALVTATNTQNQSRVILQKKVATTGNYSDAGSGFSSFVLQRTTDDPESESAVWTAVPDIDTSTGTGGKILADVDAFDADHNPYYYRFVETIPTGYYEPTTGKGAGEQVVSDYVRLATGEDGDYHAVPVKDAPTITMYNRQLMKIHLNKTFYVCGTNGRTTGTENKSTTVTLWKTTDYVNLTRVKETGEADAGQTVSNTVYADWTGLPLVDENGTALHYLIKEEDVYGYLMDEYGKYEGQSADKKFTIRTIGNVKYLEVPMTSTDGTESITMWNRQNAYPVIIWKKNYFSNSPILNQVKVTIWRLNDDGTLGDVAVSAKTSGTSYNNTPVQTANNSGTYFYLEPGYKYVFQETENTSGLEFHSYVTGSSSTGAKAEIEIGGETYGVIDLTANNCLQTYSTRNTSKSATRTINNAPEPNLRINKLDSVTNQTLSGAKFAVYTYDQASGKYMPYPDADDQLIIETTNANSGERLSEGETYYFAEVSSTVPANYLDPNVQANYTDYYSKLGSEYKWGQTSDGQYMTFYEKTITGVKDGNDVVCAFNFKNVKNVGSVKVLKYLDGTLANGYKIVIKNGNDVVAYGTTSGTGANTGSVTITNIPVYDADGNKITYTVTEELTDTQAESCTQASDPQTVTLILGKTVTKDGTATDPAATDNPGDTLAVYNTKRISFSATKVYRKSYEYDYTHYESKVAGAVIGLFIKNKTTGNWDLVPAADLTGPTGPDGTVVNPATTGSNGGISFDGLIRGEDYVMVELSAGVGNEHMFPYPFSLQFPPQGVNTTSIADSDLAKYNIVSLSGQTTENSTETSFPADEAKMINSNHWVQFDITKWLDPRRDPVIDPATGQQAKDAEGNLLWQPHFALPSEVGYDSEGNYYPDEDGKLENGVQLTPVDNVIFKLYRYIMPEGVTSVNFTKDYVPGEGWDLVGKGGTGTYTTGTLYIDGERQSGEFITDTDQNINDRYVYMLVEESIGPNSIVMNPNFKYTFWHEENTSYTVNMTGDAEGYTARDMKYVIDTVNKDDILNATPSGPGTELIYLASVRIAKYQDSYNETTGMPNEDYQPLYGATFTLTLPDGSILDTMTVGLDQQLSGPAGLSLAQSGTYQLLLPHTEGNDSDNYLLVDFANEKSYTLTAEQVKEFSFVQAIDGTNITFHGYRFPVVLTETVVPDGYSSFLSGGLDMWLCFVNVLKPNSQGQYNGESWVFNDAYFVLTYGKEGDETIPERYRNQGETLADNQVDTSWYVTNAASKDYHVSSGDTVNPSKLRIVNYPTTNTMVRLMKYGYTPTADTLGKTAAVLDSDFTDEEIAREPLQNVEMVIQKQDGTAWKYWNYKTDSTTTSVSAATFTTDEHGLFAFQRGLPEGTYRIYETAIGSGNEAYEMAYPQARARVFTVGKAMVNLTFYNPVKFDMKMIKQDMDGNALSGATFVLKKNGATAYTANAQNNYTFQDVETGTYVLTEAVAGYSSAYLTQYLTANCSGFETFATTGTALGYTYSNTGHTGEYVVSAAAPSVSALTPPADPDQDASPVFTMTVKNPKLTDVKLLKKDEKTGDALQNATFAVFYKSFDALEGDISITVPEAAEATTNPNQTATANTAKNFADAGWTRIGITYSTDSNGYITLTGRDPGVYAFFEASAPNGYGVMRNTDGKRVIYTAVVTGGIPVNVTVNPSTATVDDYSVTPTGEKTITTNWQNTDGTEVTVEALNRPKVPLKALKEINYGEMTLTASDRWTVKLNVYSDEAKTTKVGTVTINQGTDQSKDIYFKVPNSSGDPTSTNATFELGATYYLEEVITTPTSQFILEEVLKGDVAVEVAESGLYEFLVDNTDGFTITAVNDWLWGRVIFDKLDVSDHHKKLSGARFEVQYNKNEGVENAEEDWAILPGATVVETPADSGIYVAKIPLLSAEARTYRIVETAAPEGYVFVEGTHLDVVLSLKENVKEDNLYMTNSEGDGLRIVKHNNAYGASGNLDATNATHFAVYHKVDGEWVLEEHGYTSNGVYTYTRNMIPGDEYAIAEVGFDTSAYNRLDGIYDGTRKLIPEEEQVVFNGKSYDLYPLPVSSSGDVTIDAYNIPNIKPEIRKVDIGLYQGGQTYPKNNIPARMSYAIYEITADDAEMYALTGDQQPTRAQVEAFLVGKTPLITGSTGTYNPTEIINGTKASWDASDVAKRWDNNKSYLLVETKVMAAGGSYDTMVKDDPRVVWFYRTPTVAAAALDPSSPPVWTLKNKYGDADVTLEKAPVIGGDNNDIFEDVDHDNRATIESLLPEGRKVAFTITPTVTSQNQMLESFVLKETGITAQGIINRQGTIGAVDIDYAIKQIVVGSASHEVNADFGIGTNPTISALVTFYSTTAMADTDILDTTVLDDMSSNRTVTDVPEGTKAFTVSYYCTALREKTGGTDDTPGMCDKAYVLGEKFNVTATTVYASVTQIADGDSQTPAKEITQLTNHSHVDLGYWKWSDAGVLGDKPETRYDDADADVYVKTIVIPKVKIDKTRDYPTTAINSEVNYTIIVTNSGNSESVFTNPIVMDILPTAVTYVGGSAPESVTSDGGVTLSLKTQVIPGGNSTTEDESGNSVTEKENAILFKLTGDLPIGDTVRITYRAKVTKSAELFADVVNGAKLLCNDVYLTSGEPAYHTVTNPDGRPFTDENDQYGVSLADAAAALGDSPSATRRESYMEDAVNDEGNYATDQYAWLSNTIDVSLNNQTTVRLVKAVWGDRDTQGYHDEKVGVCSRTNERFSTEGWARWRLAVTNGYSDRALNGLILGDVIPKPGDGEARLSQWVLNFDHIIRVQNGGQDVDPSKYTLLFYDGSTESAQQKLLNAMSNGSFAEQGFRPASEFAEEDYPNITAFLVVFDYTPGGTDNVVLAPGASLILTYETAVEDVQDDAEFSEIAFRNDTNYFYFYYLDVNKPMQSNKVSVTLTDVPVEIQGDVWIDEDWDNTQESTNRRDYTEYDIVMMLAEAISFTITDKRTGAGATHPSQDSGDISQWDGGESIRHFRFDNLGAATTKLGVDYPYKSDGSDGEILNVKDLKGDDPYNYILDAMLNDTSLLAIFSLTGLGTGHFMSDNPDETGFSSSANFLDDNFFDGKDAGSYTTYPFYVRYANTVDQSKDIGFRMYRNLEITKVAADDTSILIPDAKFSIYGPYDDSTLKGDHTPASGTALYFVKQSDGSYALATADATGATQELVTDANGKLKVTGLNWWKEYDVKETDPAPGYDIAGTVAEAGPTVDDYPTEIKDRGNGIFTLLVPAKKNIDPNETVTVKNPRGVKVQLDVYKLLETYSEKEYTFDYELRLTAVDPEVPLKELNKVLMAKDPIETIQIAVTGDPTDGEASNTGSFAEVTLYGEGVYTFTINEIAPDPLPPGWTYDPQLEKTATVTVQWNEDTQKMVATVVYSEPYSDTDTNKDYEKFTNKYGLTGEWTPEAYKLLEGRPLVEGEFTFTVKEGGVEVATGTVDANGNVVFDPETIEYTLADVGPHTYVIEEDEVTADGVTVTVGSITVLVTVAEPGEDDAQDELKVTAEYSPEDATFINTFEAAGEWSPEVWKILDGRDMNPGETFTVTVKDADGNTLMTGSVSNGQDGQPTLFVFQDTIEYTQDDLEADFQPATFTYTITETKGQAGGVNYSEASYDVHVTIALHQNDDGTYSDELDVTDDAPDESLIFINTYSAQPVPAQPKAEKKMVGQKTGKDLTFEFVLTATDVESDGKCSYLTSDYEESGTGATPVADGDSWTKTLFIPQGTTPGTAMSVLFDEFTYTKTGIYTYTITETDITDPNVQCDSTEWTLTVTVTDNKQGKLVAATQYTAADHTASATQASFENTYNPNPAKQKLQVEKILTGEPLHDAENTNFTFTLTFVTSTVTNGCTPTTPQQIQINGKDIEDNGGSLTAMFDEITFTKEGRFVFKIVEEKENIPKVHYDETEWYAYVDVTDYGGDLLVDSVRYQNRTTGEFVTKAMATFTNTYTPEKTYFTPEVYKVVDGEPTVEEVQELFKFKLKLLSGKEGGASIAPDLTTVEIHEGETGEFGQITFTKKGTYTYEIVEIEGDHPEYYHYDTRPWLLTIEISDDADGNLIVVSHEYTREGDLSSEEQATFTNTYTPAPVQLIIPATKHMTDDSDAFEVDTTFTFTMEAKTVEADGSFLSSDYDENGDDATAIEAGDTWSKEVTVPAGQKVGTVEFDAFTYTKAGTYIYEVTEEADAVPIPGMTYAAVSRTVVVTVDDIGGELTVSAFVVDDVEDGTVILENTYNVPPVDISVEKIWDDKDDQDNIRPEKIQVALQGTYTKEDGTEVTYYVKLVNGAYVDVQDVEEAYVEISENDDGEWTYTWEDLPKYRELTCPVTYSVVEAEITYPPEFDLGYTLLEPEVEQDDDGNFFIKLTNKHVPETMDFEFTKLGEVRVATAPAADDVRGGNRSVGTITITRADGSTVEIYADAFEGATFALYREEDFDTENWKPLERDSEGNLVAPVQTSTSDADGIVSFVRVRFGTYYMVETDIGDDHKDTYWDNDAVYKVVLTAPENEDDDPTVEITVAKESSGTESDAGTGYLIEDDELGYIIVNMLISYRVKLLKVDEDNNEIVLAGAEFMLYDKSTVTLDEDGKVPENAEPLTFTVNSDTGVYTLDPDGTETTLTTNDDGEILFSRVIIGDEFYLVETKAPDPEYDHYEYRLIEYPMEIAVSATGITLTVNQPVLGPDGKITTTPITTNGVIDQPEEFPHDITLTINNKAYGDLRIVKTLSTTGPDTASFVFKIEWTDLLGIDQVRYAMITVNGGEDEAEYTLEKAIPVGTTVTVTEVDTGLQFVYVSGNGTDTIALTDAEGATHFDFTNDHGGPGGGYGLVNRFEMDDDGELIWKEKLPDSNPSGEQGGDSGVPAAPDLK